MKVSVVIPALDEAECIETAIRGALDAPFIEVPSGSAPSAGAEAGSAAVEVIVVDGGSADRTRELAEAAGARVVHAERGRARQLHAGVQASTGDVLLFLHADTRLPPAWGAAVCDALRDERVVGGAFGFRFDQSSASLRFVEFGVWVRNKLWRMPYGDQALFVRRATLAAIGGVPQLPILEDLELTARMKQRGKLALLAQPVVTSARRYVAGGPLRTMLHHWRIAASWTLGFAPARIARWAGR